MTFRTDMLAIKDAIRDAVLSPNGLDMTPHTLTIVTRTWTSGRKGKQSGSPPYYADVNLALPQRYKIRQLSMREVSSSNGRYTDGDLIVEHVTPSDGAGTGFTSAQLDPRGVTTDGVEFVYVIGGSTALAGEYALKEARLSGALSYHLVLEIRKKYF